jgi:predicted transcriptional regulator of viral defense system
MALNLLIQKGFNQPTPTRLMVNVLAINDMEDILQIYRRCRERNIIPEIADFIPTGRTKGGILETSWAIKNNPDITEEKKNIYLQRLQALPIEQRYALEQKTKEIDKEF